jgi:type VI secretion system protein ImpH
VSLADPDLPQAIRVIAANARGIGFFEAVRGIEESSPGCVPVGHQGPAAREAVRFHAHASLAFPASDVVEIEPERDAEGRLRCVLTQSFLGLYGPASPLGPALTERLLARDDSRLVRGFLDLINHRLASLFYRVHAKHHPAQNGTEGARFVARLLQLTGLEDGAASLAGARLLAFAGVIGNGGASGESIAAVVGAWLAGAPAAVEPCLPRWTALPPAACTRLGRAGKRLGKDSLAGTRIRNRTTAFGLAIGPLPAATAATLAPGGARHGELRGLLERMNPDLLDCVVELRVAGGDLPGTRLGRPGAAGMGLGARLGGRPAPGYALRFAIAAG